MTSAANQHKKGVFQDRAVGRQLMFLSESSTVQGTHVAPELGTLYVALDGMDQVFSFENVLCDIFVTYMGCLIVIKSV